MLELEGLLRERGFLRDAEFAGYIFKVKDGYIVFNTFNKEMPLVVIKQYLGDLKFSVIKLKEVTNSERASLYQNTEIKLNSVTSISVSNSTCNLKCSYCINKDTQKVKFPTPERLKAVKDLFKDAHTLYVTGGEPTIDRIELMNLLEKSSSIFKDIHIYTNGFGLDSEFISFLYSLPIPTVITLSINLDNTGSESVHMTLDRFYSTIYPLLQDNSHITIRLNVFPRDDGNVQSSVLKVLSEENRNVSAKVTYKVDHKLNEVGDNLDYVRYTKNVIDLIDSDLVNRNTEALWSRPISDINYTSIVPVRGNKGCCTNKIAMLNDKFASCPYKSNEECAVFDTPAQLAISEHQNYVCYNCSAYPFDCSKVIGTEDCNAYDDYCLKCPAIYFCNMHCSLLKGVKSESCTLFTFLHAFHIWLGCKDKTVKEVLTMWNFNQQEGETE